MEPPYVIIVVRNLVEATCYGPFQNYARAKEVFQNHPTLFDIDDKEVMVYITPLKGFTE